MEKLDLSDPKVWLGLILGILAYLLVDAHKSIKVGIAKKADKEGLDALEKRHTDEMARIERVYENRLTTITAHFSERINSMEKNLGDRMDMVIKILEHNSGT